MVAANLIDAAVKDSVQPHSDTTFEQGAMLLYRPHYDILPAWGTRERDRVLREFWRAVHGSMYQGAISGVVKKIAATPWEIKGGRGQKRRVRYFQSIFQEANFGAGWDYFISKFLTDYLTQDFGSTIEVIAPGDPSKPLEPTAITGIATLDSLSCGATDNPEYPLIYQSRKKPDGIHVLHRERAIRFVDMPDPDEQALDTGLCALSRMISPVNVQIMMGRHQNEKLSDLPMPGIAVVKGMTAAQFELAMRQFEADRRSAGQAILRNIMKLAASDPDNPPDIKFISFSEVPEGFDYEKYMNMHALLIAAALNIDQQEFWALQARSLGSGTQTEILHTKGERKGYAHLYAIITRAMNLLLPPDLTFEFKFKDAQSDKEAAERAQLWSGIALSLSTILTPRQQAQLLANNVEQFADVLLDEDGQVKLPDDDVLPEDQPTVVGDDESAGTPEVAPATDATPVQKDFGDTAADFGRDFYDLITAGINDEVSRRRFGIVARAQLRNYGTRFYKDGMGFGGVTGEDLTSTDLSTITDWLAETSEYVTNFANSVYDGGVSDAQIRTHVDMWVNKSARDIFNRGVMAADADAMMQWHYDPAKEHCDSCKKLHGQIHRMSAWVERDLLPGSSELECGGYHCGCELRRTNKRASGSFLTRAIFTPAKGAAALSTTKAA